MPEPKGSAVATVKAKLKKEYPGKAGLPKVFGTLNKIGLMHGNEPTPKGMKQSKAKDKVSPRPAKPKAGRPGRGRGI